MEQVYEIVSIRRVGPPPGAIGLKPFAFVLDSRLAVTEEES